MSIEIFSIGMSLVCIAIGVAIRRRTIALFPQSATHVVYAALGMTVFSVLAFLSPNIGWRALLFITTLAFVALSVFLSYWKGRHDRGTL